MAKIVRVSHRSNADRTSHLCHGIVPFSKGEIFDDYASSEATSDATGTSEPATLLKEKRKVKLGVNQYDCFWTPCGAPHEDGSIRFAYVEFLAPLDGTINNLSTDEWNISSGKATNDIVNYRNHDFEIIEGTNNEPTFTLSSLTSNIFSPSGSNTYNLKVELTYKYNNISYTKDVLNDDTSTVTEEIIGGRKILRADVYLGPQKHYEIGSRKTDSRFETQEGILDPAVNGNLHLKVWIELYHQMDFCEVKTILYNDKAYPYPSEPPLINQNNEDVDTTPTKALYLEHDLPIEGIFELKFSTTDGSPAYAYPINRKLKNIKRSSDTSYNWTLPITTIGDMQGWPVRWVISFDSESTAIELSERPIYTAPIYETWNETVREGNLPRRYGNATLSINGWLIPMMNNIPDSELERRFNFGREKFKELFYNAQLSDPWAADELGLDKDTSELNFGYKWNLEYYSTGKENNIGNPLNVMLTASPYAIDWLSTTILYDHSIRPYHINGLTYKSMSSQTGVYFDKTKNLTSQSWNVFGRWDSRHTNNGSRPKVGNIDGATVSTGIQGGWKGYDYNNECQNNLMQYWLATGDIWALDQAEYYGTLMQCHLADAGEPNITGSPGSTYGGFISAEGETRAFGTMYVLWLMTNNDDIKEHILNRFKRMLYGEPTTNPLLWKEPWRPLFSKKNGIKPSKLCGLGDEIDDEVYYTISPWKSAIGVPYYILASFDWQNTTIYGSNAGIDSAALLYVAEEIVYQIINVMTKYGKSTDQNRPVYQLSNDQCFDFILENSAETSIFELGFIMHQIIGVENDGSVFGQYNSDEVYNTTMIETMISMIWPAINSYKIFEEATNSRLDSISVLKVEYLINAIKNYAKCCPTNTLLTTQIGDDEVTTYSCGEWTYEKPTEPRAAFTFTINSYPDLHQVNFKDTSSAGNGSIISRVWNFNDGLAEFNTTSTSFTRSFPVTSGRYPDSKVYFVSLTITTENGSHTIIKPVIIYAVLPRANFTAFDVSNNECNCTILTNSKIWFYDQSLTPPGSSLTYDWDYGDGTSHGTSNNVIHTYTTANTNDVILTVTNSEGSDSITLNSFIDVVTPGSGVFIDVRTEPSVGEAPLTTQTVNNSLNGTTTRWDFGDGSPITTDFKPAHTYTEAGTYNMIFTIDYGLPTEDTTIIPVTVLEPTLYANFTTSSDISLVGSPIVFDATSSITINESTTTYQWWFDWPNGPFDGDLAGKLPDNPLLESPSYTYNYEGTYTVRLLLTDENGKVSEKLYEDIQIASTLATPVSSFTTSVTEGDPPLSVTFTNLSINADNYLWDFGDGSTSTTESPTHIYSTTGDYTASLTSYNSNGTNVKSIVITVNEVERLPEADFTVSSTFGTVPLTVNFTDTTENSPSSWEWDFGDGDTSTSQNPSHTYTTAGSYTVQLKASNAFGFGLKINRNYIVVSDRPDPTRRFSQTGVV